MLNNRPIYFVGSVANSGNTTSGNTQFTFVESQTGTHPVTCGAFTIYNTGNSPFHVTLNNESVQHLVPVSGNYSPNYLELHSVTIVESGSAYRYDGLY